MNGKILIASFLIPIALFFVAGILGFAKKNTLVMRLTKIAPPIGIAVSLASLFWVFPNGLIESDSIAINDLGLSLRFDTLSVIMFSMVSTIALVVLRFSYNYLDGDANQAPFIGNLSITIAFVLLLILSGNILILFLSWVAVSVALHKLLIFYPERRKAVLAARKKFIVARVGDATLLFALGLIYFEFGSGNLEVIFEELRQLKLGEVSFELELSAILLVISAGLKSAQLPFHGWLIEVMETPTPVSALLHAGLLNAGPFLMIRFAYLLEAVHYGPIILFTMGAITALFGAIVFTTQPSIKTGLAYSSVAHMGFTLMICGLGVYPAALLHLMAHSFYKAHSFLSSGSIIEKVRTKQAVKFSRKGSLWRIMAGFVAAISLFIALGWFWGVNLNSEFQLLIIAGVILTGIISLIVNALDSNNLGRSIVQIIGGAFLVIVLFFALEKFVRVYLGNQSPAIAEPSSVMMCLSGITLIIFFITVLILTLSPVLKKRNRVKHFGVHVRNGFYLNVVFDRMLSSLNKKEAASKV